MPGRSKRAAAEAAPAISERGKRSRKKAAAQAASNDAAGVVWAKVQGSPWWPAYLSEPNEVHEKVSRPPSHTEFVVFYGGGNAYAWVSPDAHVKPFAAHLDAHAKMTAKASAAFRQAVQDACQDADVVCPPKILPRGARKAVTEKVKPPKNKKGGKGIGSAEAVVEAEAVKAEAVEAEAVEAAHRGDEALVSPGMSDYEQARLARMAANAEMLRSLGIATEKSALTGGFPSAKPTRGARSAPRKQVTRVATRASSRQRGEAAANIYLDSDANGRIKVVGQPGSLTLDTTTSSELSRPLVSQQPNRIDDDITVGGDADASGEAFLAKLRQLGKESRRSPGSRPKVTSDELECSRRLSTLHLRGEDDVVKVVPQRGTAVVFHPATSKLVVAVGDKMGSVGVVDVDDVGGENDGVQRFDHHTGMVATLEFNPRDPCQLFSTSYDDSVRCLDVAKGVSQQVYVHPSETARLNWGRFSPAGDIMLLADSQGVVTSVDPRAGHKALWAHDLANGCKVNTVDFCRSDPHYIVTAGNERYARIWDLRNASAKLSKMKVSEMSDTNSINSAYFSPSGSQVVACGYSNKLRLYTSPQTKSGPLQPNHELHHDNKTGRYLSTFHAVWSPTMPDCFVVGSMHRPRQVEVFSAFQSKLKRVMVYQSDLIASVMSRNAFHPTLDVLGCTNSSGRLHVLR